MDRPLVICASFKDQARYLVEWIAYHCAIGFDRFVLYDNVSTDGGSDAIRRSPLSERVAVIQWPQDQLSAYRHFIDIFAPAYEWAAFIDVDEFILPLGGHSLQDVLRRCADASAVLVNGRVFGPSGHEEPPPGLVIESYDQRVNDTLPVNRYVKSIVRCAELLDVTQDPRIFRLKGAACNPLGQEVPNVAVQRDACFQNLVINHYYTKSRRDWLARVASGSASGNEAEPQYPDDLFDQFAAACQVKDEAIKAYAPQVRAMLGAASGSAPPVPAPFSPLPAPAPIAASPEATVAAGQPAPAPVAVPPAPAPAAPAWFPPGFPTGGFASVQSPTAAMPVPARAEAERWRACGSDAREYAGGLALVFRDRSRPAAPWLAALRGDAAGLIDPDFLLDEAGRLRDFPTEQEACSACEAALADLGAG